MKKFTEIPYTRPEADALKADLTALTEKFASAKTYEEAKAAFLEKQAVQAHVETQMSLASIRHSIDTRDTFYDAEEEFWNNEMPLLQEVLQAWDDAFYQTPFRKEFEAEYGDLLFLNTEISLKAFSPEIIPEMQKENALVQEYEKLIASAQIPFEGGVYTLSQMTPFKNSADDSLRLSAWKAEGQWYKDHQADLDRIYDELTHLRDSAGKKMGYGGYTRLGYYRMSRNCYGKEDVEKFREAVRTYVVPVADALCREQAERTGLPYPLSFADYALKFREGNPAPKGTAQDILDAALTFYSELSPETKEFFTGMREREMMDVLSTEGKQGGGYCTSLPEEHTPFIFANFNGTQGDVEVVTHEAGHAFEWWMNRDRVPLEYGWASMEASEVHSMSMEFLAWPWEELFFGDDADRFRRAHLADALTFIPYGTMVDHFQHIVYEKPEMTPAERHGVWKELLGVYMPWLRLDGDIPFYSEGEGWQRQSHIYASPFYYIDYCLAQTVSLEIWALMQKDRKEAWERYMAYTVQGGSRTFTDLLKNAGLKSPFDEECLKTVCRAATAWLKEAR